MGWDLPEPTHSDSLVPCGEQAFCLLTHILPAELSWLDILRLIIFQKPRKENPATSLMASGVTTHHSKAWALLSSWNVRSGIEELNFTFYSKLFNWKLQLNGHTCLVTTILGHAESSTKGRETRWVMLWKLRKNYCVKIRVLTLRVWPRWQGRKTLSATPPMGTPEL